MPKTLKNITKVFAVFLSIIILGGIVNTLSGHEENPELQRLNAIEAQRIKDSRVGWDANIMGGTTSEDKLKSMNERDSLSFSDTYIIGRRYLSVSSALNQWLDRAGAQPDPSFNLKVSFGTLTEGVPLEQWETFRGIQSNQEGKVLREQLFQEMKDKAILGLK